jgi:hypothetical protein
MFILLLILTIVASKPVNPTLDAGYERVINRAIRKIWKEKEVIKVPVRCDLNEMYFREGSLFKLESESDTLGWLCIRTASGCKIGGCGVGNYASWPTLNLSESYEKFDYALIADPDFQILKVIILDYPGVYGYEICSPAWLKQFKGYRGGKLTYGHDIQAISGATISANSITEDIVEVHRQLTTGLKSE